MPPSTFARNGNQGGFAAVLQQLFGALGKGAYGYRAYQKYGPGYQQELDKQDLARQESEIALRQHQANLDYEPIKQAQGRIQNATSRAAYAKSLEQLVSDTIQGQEGQTEDAPLPQAGPFDLQIPAGTGPLATGFKPREPTMPDLDPAMVAESGMSPAAILAAAKGSYDLNKRQMAAFTGGQRSAAAAVTEAGRNQRQGTGIKARLDLQTMLETGRNARAQASQSGVESRFGRGETRRASEFNQNQARLAGNDEQRTLDTIDRMDQATLNSRSHLLQAELRNLDPNDDNYDADRAKLIGALQAIDAKLAAPRAPRAPRAGGASPNNPPPPPTAHPPGAFVMRNGTKTGVPWDALTPEEQRAALGGR